MEKVAGPVGEALIVTALGLAVAITAVLAYNFAVRRNRVVLARGAMEERMRAAASRSRSSIFPPTARRSISAWRKSWQLPPGRGS